MALAVQAGCASSAAKQGLAKYPLVDVAERSEVCQYGITWKFDHAVKSGQFINGDWWVVGPVTVVSVTPGPVAGPLANEVNLKDAVKDDVKKYTEPMRSIMGYIAPDFAKSCSDTRWRNGSMVIEQFGPKQGYDSRSPSYDPTCSVAFPYQLAVNRTLISTISNANPVAQNFAHKLMWGTEKTQRTLLRSAALLTCLASQPPDDAFRPAYAGTQKTIYQAKDLKWDLLLNLKLDNMESYFQRPWLTPTDPKCEAATWEDFEKLFQPPWIGGFNANGFDEVLACMQPNENQPTTFFGREDARLVSIASLMLHLDVPKARKEKLLIELVQRGIDLSEMFKVGADQPSVYLHSGCKWPIIFASLMLDKPELRQLPPRLPFYEDIATYYGTGWFGQTALWRIIWHDHLIDSCEERAPEQMTGNDGISEHYRSYAGSGKAWLGTALSVRLMKAVKLWRHDAFFDYCDRWLPEDPVLTAARGVHKQPVWETQTWDPFVDAMWRAYRRNAPEQEMSGDNIKAEWEHTAQGWSIRWVPNPKPDPKDVADHVAAIHKAFPQAYATTKPSAP